MNKQQIKAELRRSACEDECPGRTMKVQAWSAQDRFRDFDEYGTMPIMDDYVQRTFFLLVAEAL